MLRVPTPMVGQDRGPTVTSGAVSCFLDKADKEQVCCEKTVQTTTEFQISKPKDCEVLDKDDHVFRKRLRTAARREART